MTRLVFLAFLAAAGCSSVVAPTAARLGLMNPMTADPAGFAVRVTLPPKAGVVPNSAMLSLQSKRTDTAQSLEGVYILQERPTLDGARVFRIAPSDLDALRNTQQTAMKWESEAPRAHSGSLSVGIQGCIIGDGPAPDELINVDLQVKKDGRFMPLIRNAKWQEVLAVTEAGQPIQCPSALDVVR